MYLCYFMPLSLWQFVTAAAGNESSGTRTSELLSVMMMTNVPGTRCLSKSTLLIQGQNKNVNTERQEEENKPPPNITRCDVKQQI